MPRKVNPITQKRLATVPVLAERWSISRSTAYEMVSRGQIPAEAVIRLSAHKIRIDVFLAESLMRDSARRLERNGGP